MAGQATGRIAFTHADFVVWVAPAVALAGAAALRRPLPHIVWQVLWCCALASAASLVAVRLVPHTLDVVAVPAAAVGAVVCTRRPVIAVLLLFVVSSTFGSLTAFTSIPPSKTVELLLAGLWLGVAWRWFVSGRSLPIAFIPGAVVLIAFIALTFAQGMGATPLSTGFRTFVSTGFYMSSVLLVGMLGLDSRQLNRIARGVVVVAVLVVAYAMLRHAIGPSHQEQAIGAQQPFNYKDGKLLLIGSFMSRHQMGEWSGLLAAFCAGYATVVRGPVRWACFAVVPMAGLACLWSESRSGLSGGIVGIVVVLVLLHLTRAVPGPRLGAILAAVAIILIGGGAAIAVSGGTGSAQTKKFTGILHPTQDAAYQARQKKWRQTIEDIRAQPLGHGLGTANQLQQQTGRFRTIGNFDIDNSILRVAYEQGVQGAMLFVAGILLLLVGLVRRAAATTDPARAGPAIASAGVLAAYVVMLYPSNVFDGYTALTAWVLAGVGLAPFLARRPSPVEQAASVSATEAPPQFAPALR